MEIIYLSLHCHHQNDSCIEMGSDEGHFNVSAESDGQSHKSAPPNPPLSHPVSVPQLSESPTALDLHLQIHPFSHPVSVPQLSESPTAISLHLQIPLILQMDLMHDCSAPLRNWPPDV